MTFPAICEQYREWNDGKEHRKFKNSFSDYQVINLLTIIILLYILLIKLILQCSHLEFRNLLFNLFAVYLEVSMGNLNFWYFLPNNHKVWIEVKWVIDVFLTWSGFLQIWDFFFFIYLFFFFLGGGVVRGRIACLALGSFLILFSTLSELIVYDSRLEFEMDIRQINIGYA